MTNRLANEKSPYLLQHAKNPVDWYPWGQEAFNAAISAEKPVFLSIGYSTCHWCHVMEKESFENVEIAQLLNENFICIKVDREEHPEVDNIYMEFAQALLGSPAGWPLNLFLTPDLKPFFAATYLPPSSKQGMIGFPQIIEQIKVLWNGEERHMITEQAAKVVETFAHTSNATGQELPSVQDMTTGAERFFESADPVNGGLKGEPKFPLSYQGEFLLSYAKKSGDGRALFYVELTFEMMRRGGIYDQIGGGFSRYSVDERWEIPHFEKMLYDNATLTTAYLQAWKYTKKEVYATVCRETCNYLLRDLKHTEGGFYSGEDADSGGYEGLYYTWTPMEVEEVIQGDDFDLCSSLFDITHAGNFDGRNVLHLETSEEEFAESFNVDATELSVKISQWKKALLRRRDTRPRPMRDEKILVSWNGLAIDALARCGIALDEPSFLQAAIESATFIRNQLWNEVEGRLLHRWCKGEAKFGALLDDYAFFIKALLTLYELGIGEQWLEWAVQMAKIVERDFKEIEGAFYQTDGRDPLILRKCEFYDGAEPSGNAVHAENLLRLYQITQDEWYLRQAEDILKASKKYIAAFAPGASYHLLALQRLLDTSAPTVIVSLDKEESLKKEINKALAIHFCPTLIVIWKREKDLVDGKTTLYLCRQNKCDAPLTKFSEIVKVIETL